MSRGETPSEKEIFITSTTYLSALHHTALLLIMTYLGYSSYGFLLVGLKMNKAQKDFYESNTKVAHNARREGDIRLAVQLLTINQFLKNGEISKALEWADSYNMALEFILDMKDLFCGFKE